MTLPDRRAWLFSAKTFGAAMLAAYVSLRIGLPRPYWAMATCCAAMCKALPPA